MRPKYLKTLDGRNGRSDPRVPLVLLLLSFGTTVFATVQPVISPEQPPATPRELFNAGTQKLKAGKLREAEAFLESSLSSQTESLQPFTLYNLGQIGRASCRERG